MTERIIEMFSAAEIALSREQAERFLALYEFMIDYNKNVNLTAITEFEDVVLKHFIDSVLPFSMIEFEEKFGEAASIIDVGTGAGFPSLPLLIVYPKLRATLCDSLKKRCVYLEKACEKIGVRAEIVHARGEELAAKRRERYDIATARAVATLPILTELCLPFVRVGGRFMALKSINEDVSLAENAVKTLGGVIERTCDYKLPNGDDRRVIVMDKASATPARFPRSYANIAKKPL